MPSRTPFEYAVSPASAWPTVNAASRGIPSRSATTAAQRVRTGARLIRSVRDGCISRRGWVRLQGLVASIAEGWRRRVLAPAHVDRLLLGGRKLRWREARVLVRSIAERLALRAPAGAPVVVARL